MTLGSPWWPPWHLGTGRTSIGGKPPDPLGITLTNTSHGGSGWFPWKTIFRYKQGVHFHVSESECIRCLLFLKGESYKDLVHKMHLFVQSVGLPDDSTDVRRMTTDDVGDL